MRYPTVLFDLDHTLFDSDTSLQRSFSATLQRAGIGDPDAHYPWFNEVNHGLWRQVEAGTMTPPEVHVERFRALAEHLQLDIAATTMAGWYASALTTHGELYPGARELLDQLAGAGVLMALVTNGLSDVQRTRIGRLGVADYFAAVIISAEVGVAKPGPEIFDLTFGALGEPEPAGALMVGDNPPSDIRGGNDYGIATCWYNPHGRAAPADIAATHEVAALADIASIVLG